MRTVLLGGTSWANFVISYDFSLSYCSCRARNISERRCTTYNGASWFTRISVIILIEFWFMIPQYAAVFMVSQNKMYCHAASSDSTVSSNGQEDHVSMGLMRLQSYIRWWITWTHSAIELMNAAQGIEFRRPEKNPRKLERFWPNIERSSFC